MQLLSITGAGSFIGRHLLDKLSIRNDIKIKAMISDPSNCAISTKNNISLFHGDLLKVETLNGFVEEGGTVVNLAYLRDGSSNDNMGALENLLEICGRAKIKRFIHCSTAVVTGKVRGNIVTESTICNPVTKYEKTKLLLEDALLKESNKKFESVILRPTAVFGAGGKNLLKLANDICYGNRLTNYLKSCVYNKRKMNLVCVANVVSAIEYLIDTTTKVGMQVFIVSDDENPFNNYRDIEKYLIARLGYSDYIFLRITLPSVLLKLLLMVVGKSNINPEQIYDCQKLMRFGFKKALDFVSALDEFIVWYQQQQKQTIIADK